jgi:ABC-2 type transport system ATP-binding protein
MECPVKINGVWKSYGTHAAVQGLSLSVPAQSVYAFLGPNGAGKSTTIRMILGLQRPDRGSVSLFGRSLESERSALLARIGSLVEAPSLYLHLTGRENLELHRRLLNTKKNAIAEALETVGLLSAANRVVRSYSSGMKQRLGLAQALLGGPELLVLDEPTNGLDPAGMHEVRTLIRDLPRQRGVTLFLSSHLLGEVDQVANHFAIISDGQLRFEGTPEQLRLRTNPIVMAEVDDLDRAKSLLEYTSIAFRVEGRNLLITPSGKYGSAEINSLLVRSGIAVTQIVTRHPKLEDTFLELTGCSVHREENALPK